MTASPPDDPGFKDKPGSENAWVLPGQALALEPAR
jgi:hypothetical protein